MAGEPVAIVPDDDFRYDSTSVGGGPASSDARKTWIAGEYIGLLAAQAGYPWQLNRSEADIHSLDGHVLLHPGGSSFVQVKGRRPHFPRSVSYQIKAAWRRNWSSLRMPTYFVVVTVPDDVAQNWVHHGDGTHDTLLRLSGYWARIDPLPTDAKSVQVLRKNRLTIETFEHWRRNYIDATRHGFGVSGDT